MTNTNKIIAEILVSEGYADRFQVMSTAESCYKIYVCAHWEEVEPFYSGDNIGRECYVRRQLDVLEKYFRVATLLQWSAVGIVNSRDRCREIATTAYYNDPREARIACIKLCLEHTNKGTGGKDSE